MDKQESNSQSENVHRKILYTAVSGILLEKGFNSVEHECLETLTEIIQSLTMEIGTSSRSYCELSGRTIPVLGDVVVALVNMGISLQGLEAFAKRENRQVIPLPPQASQQKQLNLLQAGIKNSHPTYIPNYFPVLPDPHAYIRTPTHKQPVTEYEAIREKAANQKRDIEKALTKFLAKTSEIHSLFDTEDNIFPLIACNPAFPSYLAALNPTDQVFDFEELEYHYLVANRTEDVPSKDNGSESCNEDDGDESKSEQQEQKDKKTDVEIKPNSATNNAILNNPNIDNPYLRAATLPKKPKAEIVFPTLPQPNTSH